MVCTVSTHDFKIMEFFEKLNSINHLHFLVTRFKTKPMYQWNWIRKLYIYVNINTYITKTRFVNMGIGMYNITYFTHFSTWWRIKDFIWFLCLGLFKLRAFHCWILLSVWNSLILRLDSNMFLLDPSEAEFFMYFRWDKRFNNSTINLETSFHNHFLSLKRQFRHQNSLSLTMIVMVWFEFLFEYKSKISVSFNNEKKHAHADNIQF